MTWFSYVEGTDFLEILFPRAAPSLDEIILHEISLRRDGPIIVVRFDLNEYAEVPPKKWVDNGFNRVNITLMAIAVSSVSLFGWDNELVSSIELSEMDEHKYVELKGTSLNARFRCLELRIDKVSGYLDGGVGE